VVVDTKLDEESLMQKQAVTTAAYIGSDNYRGGQLAAEYILQKINNPSARIIFFEGVPDQETAQQRKKGFLDALASRNITPSESHVGDWNKERAYNLMSNLIARRTSFDAIFASNDQMALGAIEAIERNRISPSTKVIVGFDAIPEAITAINNRRLTATVRQRPRDMGMMAMQIAVAIIEKKPFEKNNPIPVEIVD
jgi:ribose transport system substrate-binding protein